MLIKYKKSIRFILEIFSKNVCTFAAVKQKQLKSRKMEALDKEGMANIMGGGWYYLPDGTKVYLPDDEGDDDDIIFV